MEYKKVANIGFYYNPVIGCDEACLFYDDGTDEIVDYEKGIDVCEEIVKDYNITTKDELKDLINNETIYTMTFHDFEIYREKFNEMSLYKNSDSLEDDEKEDDEIENEEDFDNEYYLYDDEGNIVGFDYNKYREDEQKWLNEGTKKLKLDDSIDENSEDLDNGSKDENSEELDNDFSNDDIDDKKEEKKEGKIKRWFKERFKWFTNLRPVKKIILYVASIVTAFTVGACSGYNLNSKTGEIKEANFNVETNDVDNLIATNGLQEYSIENVVIEDNSQCNDFSSRELLKVTTNKLQKVSMRKIRNTINKFNGKFANAHKEDDKDVKAALSFDELVALQNAYNDYTPNQIKAYFNGALIDASEMEKDYQSATLQLMGAHVIETKENPVNMSSLLKNDKEKDFYNKYHDQHLLLKELSGDELIAEGKKFKQMILEDFPITQEVRTEGIMHRDDRDAIESYKLSVVPIIAAVEMMYQNLDVDFTLNDGEIDFLNDIGLCNYAQDKFDRIERITSNSFEDKTNPSYKQYRKAIIKEMKDKEQYVIDDEHRDLSKLDAYQARVNYNFTIDDNGNFNGVIQPVTTTGTETKTWTTQSTTYHEETTKEKKKIPEDEKKKIDKKIKKENKKAKEEAYKAAEEKEKEMQAEADEEAEKVQQEVDQINQDTQDNIDAANDRIDGNNSDTDTSNDKPINESDIGNGAEFDDDYSNENGDLDDSVQDITTDSSNDQTDIELPDPNETGAVFDQNVFESEGTETLSNEELVDAYIEGLANTPAEDVEAYVYSKY